MHALLNDNEGEDVLFMQEPWFNPVGTARCDTMYQGKDILGGAANPKWRLAYLLRSVDRSVRLGRLGVCPECQMAEVGKRLDYNGVRTTERWMNTQGESACQALKRMEGRDSAKYALRGCIGEVAEALQSIQLGPSDTRSQSYRLLAKLSSLIY
jgi:hypothetical protein